MRVEPPRHAGACALQMRESGVTGGAPNAGHEANNRIEAETDFVPASEYRIHELETSAINGSSSVVSLSAVRHWAELFRGARTSTSISAEHRGAFVSCTRLLDEWS